MFISYSAQDIQSLPLTMLVSHILDPNGKKIIKKISDDILHRIDQPILVLDKQGEVVKTNKAFVDLYLSEVSSRDGEICLKEMDFGDEEVVRILDFGIPILNCLDNLLIDEHTVVSVNLHIYPIFSSNKFRSGALCIFQDITHEVSYNKLLKQSEIILNTINTGVVALDKGFRITMLNNYAEKCFGFSRKLIGQEFGELIGQIIKDPAKIMHSLTKQEEIRDQELVFYNNNDEYYCICDTYLLKDDEPCGTMMFFKDITKIKEIESQLAKSEKLSIIGELAAGMAHEIRNPMTTVRGFVQMLNEEFHKKEIKNYDDKLGLILSEIDRVNQIITDFLNLAKPKPSRIQMLDINKLLSEVMFLIENEALRQGIEINKVLAPTLPPVSGDKNQLSQVFLNIISNAFQAMSEKGVLTIKSAASHDQSQVIVDFIDNGAGIPEEVLNKIFNPFFSTKGDGTGLGLAISNRIITDHQGEIKVVSSEAGTTFSIFLPALKGTQGDSASVLIA